MSHGVSPKSCSPFRCNPVPCTLTKPARGLLYSMFGSLLASAAALIRRSINSRIVIATLITNTNRVSIEGHILVSNTVLKQTSSQTA